MTATDNIHRYLDDAFADVPGSPETADLKEELRGNLQARVAELQSRGTDAATAAPSTAVAELDIPELIAGLESEPGAEFLEQRPRRPCDFIGSVRSPASSSARASPPSFSWRARCMS